MHNSSVDRVCETPEVVSLPADAKCVEVESKAAAVAPFSTTNPRYCFLPECYASLVPQDSFMEKDERKIVRGTHSTN